MTSVRRSTPGPSRSKCIRIESLGSSFFLRGRTKRVSSWGQQKSHVRVVNLGRVTGCLKSLYNRSPTSTILTFRVDLVFQPHFFWVCWFSLLPTKPVVYVSQVLSLPDTQRGVMSSLVEQVPVCRSFTLSVLSMVPSGWGLRIGGTRFLCFGETKVLRDVVIESLLLPRCRPERPLFLTLTSKYVRRFNRKC